MVCEKMVVIKSKQGLHARPAALFVQIANKFDCDIAVSKGNVKVNGKSIMGIMMLEAGKGSRVTITATGNDSHQAVEELEKVLASENDESTLGNM
jgi:phosphocarrier protein